MFFNGLINVGKEYKEKTIFKHKIETENKFNEIYENIIEIDTKGKERNRRNSTKEPSIFSIKNKENQISINKKKTKNTEEDVNNRFILISQLKKKEEKNSQNTNSLNIKNEGKSENTNSLRKNSNNLSFKSYKTISPKNFVLKSEIIKLNKKNNSYNKTRYSDNKDINKLNIFSEKIQNKEQSNKYYCYLLDKNNDNLKIESTTYEDKDKNEEIENKFNLNKSLGMNNININIKTSITNYYLNNPNKEDDFEEKLSMKNIYQNSINCNNIEKKVNNEISGNINEFLNNNFPSNNKIIKRQVKEKQKDINNKTDKKNLLELNNINNYNNLSNAHTNNNFINKKSYFHQKQNKFNMNISGYYYPLCTSASPFNYQNNLNLFQYYNNNYYSYNYSNNKNMEMNSNIYYINNLNQNDFYKTNNNINRNNIMDNNSFTSKNLLSLIKTPFGFQFLKEKSLNDHKFANEILFPKMKDNLKDICIDLFGNCLMQILLDILTYDNIDAFISYTNEFLYNICLTEPGSRLIQKLIEKINDQPLLLNKFVFNLSNKNIGKLFMSQYGNYILQKYLSIIKKKEFTNFLYNYIYNNFISLIRDKHGVLVLQKSILEADEEQRKKLLDLILINLELIMKDCFGIFLIQYLFTNLDHFKFEDLLPIVKKLENNIVDYCKFRFSASVIEKCFERGDSEISGHIIKNLVDNHLDSIIGILTNPFGFYVIKKSLKIQDENYKRKIIQFIWSNKDKLCKTNYGNKIISIISSEHKKYL